MAGDIGIQESLLPSGPSEMGLSPAAAPTRVLHEYGPSVRIRIGGLPMGGRATAPLNPAALSENERLGLSALRLRESPQYAVDKEKRSYKDVGWANGPKPLHLHEQAIVGRSTQSQGGGTGGSGGTGGGAGASGGGTVSAAPLAKRLKGRIAIGTILVSGPGPLALTTAQQVKIAAEVQNGLSWLGAQSPAKDITWVHDSRHVTVPTAPPAPPSGSVDPWEYYERPWRDAALAQLGFPSGAAGVDAYINTLRTGKTADSAYCAFFVHYPLNHFAYCTGPYLVMQYENDGWGPDNLDRVFAHESGHVFGAPDEYALAGCNCGGSHGFFGQPNLNCESCAPGGGVDCIMKNNSWAMCSITPYHLGYDGLPVSPPTVLAPHVA